MLYHYPSPRGHPCGSMNEREVLKGKILQGGSKKFIFSRPSTWTSGLTWNRKLGRNCLFREVTIAKKHVYIKTMIQAEYKLFSLHHS